MKLLNDSGCRCFFLCVALVTNSTENQPISQTQIVAPCLDNTMKSHTIKSKIAQFFGEFVSAL